MRYDRLGLSIGYYGDLIKLKKMVLKSPISFISSTNQIIIGITSNTYMVISQDYEPRYVCVTYTEPSMNGYSVQDKFVFSAQAVFNNKQEECIHGSN